MDSSRPELVSKLLEALLNERDIDGLLGLYEEDAVFVDLDGVARGPAAIRAVHQRFLESGLILTLQDSLVFEADNIALVHWSWSVRRADGSIAEGTSAEVLRRQDDGTWKFIIDNSDGSALLGHAEWRARKSGNPASDLPEHPIERTGNGRQVDRLDQ